MFCFIGYANKSQNVLYFITLTNHEVCKISYYGNASFMELFYMMSSLLKAGFPVGKIFMMAMPANHVITTCILE